MPKGALSLRKESSSMKMGLDWFQSRIRYSVKGKFFCSFLELNMVL
jgi:hypothetical protein